MSPQIANLGEWMTYDQVLAATGLTRRTLERQVAKGEWVTRTRPRPGSIRPVIVFDPDQVAARVPPPLHSIVSARQSQLAEKGEAPLSMDAMVELAAMVCEKVLVSIAPKPEAPKALFVDLPEASAITGLSEGCLRKLVEEGKILHTKDRSKDRHYRVIKVRRADLETFEP